jgi:hypothetical protein
MSKKGKKPGLIRASTGKPKVYQGKRAVRPAIRWDSSPELSAIEAKLGLRLARFIGHYLVLGSAAAAARRLDPRMSDVASGARGYQFMKQARERLSTEDWDALHGLYRSRIVETIAEGLGAQTTKDFILPRSGRIISTPPAPDWQARAKFCDLGMKATKMTDPEGVNFQVNIVNFSSGPPQRGEWGSGFKFNPESGKYDGPRCEKMAADVITAPIDVTPIPDDDDPDAFVFGTKTPRREDDV